MEVHARTIEFKEKTRLVPIGDIHLGARACDEGRLDRLISWILSKEDTYIIGMGDYVDAIVRQDIKRFSGTCTKEDLLDMLDDMLNEQTKLAIKKFKPLADAGRILGLLKGNHEYTMQKDHSYNIHREICEKLDVPNLGYSCFYRLTLKRPKSNIKRNVIIYAHHGWGGGRRAGASVNKLEDAVAKYDADIYLEGHDHQKFGKRFIRLAVSPSGAAQLRHKPVITARTGTFLKTCEIGDTTYAERFGFPPADLGVVKITMRFVGHDKELDIHVSE